MNVKNNKRRRESREAIERVFVSLLQNRELTEISVSDICKEAGLNRSTFYANYEDIYALADAIREELEQEIHKLYAEDYVNGFSSNDYLRLFRHVRENQLFYRTFFKLGYDQSYTVTLYDRAQAERYFGNQYMDYHITFFMSGLNAMIKKWLSGGCRETPEEMNAILEQEYQGRLPYRAPAEGPGQTQ